MNVGHVLNLLCANGHICCLNHKLDLLPTTVKLMFGVNIVKINCTSDLLWYCVSPYWIFQWYFML